MSRVVTVPPRQRRVRWARASGRSTAITTSSSRARRSSFFVPCRGGGGGPNALEIVTESAKTVRVGGTQHAWALGLTAGQFALGLVELSQTPLPICFESARDEPILGLHGAVASLGLLGFVLCPFDGEAPQGEGKALGAKPQPGLAGRSELGEAREDGADGPDDGLVRMEPDLALLVAPDEADGQAAAEGAALGLMANASVETFAPGVQFRLGHGAFETEDQAVVEQGGVVDAIGIGEQGVGDATQVEEAIPVCVAARHA